MNHIKKPSKLNSILLCIILFVFLSGLKLDTADFSHDILNSEKDRKVKANSLVDTITYDYIFKNDGYIVGIEKSRDVADQITQCSDETFKNKNSKLCEIVDSHMGSFWLPHFMEKRMVLTHIVSFNANKSLNEDCILFNMVNEIKNKSKLKNCSSGIVHQEMEKYEYIPKALNSIDRLNLDMKLKLKSGQYTHLFLISTGWNTAQGESILNYNDIF